MAEDERTKKIFSRTLSFNKRLEIVSAVERMVCPVDLNFEKDETNDMQTHFAYMYNS